MIVRKISLLAWIITVSVFVGVGLGFFVNSGPECQISAQQEERYDALYKDCLVQRPKYHPATCMEVAKEMICGD